MKPLSVRFKCFGPYVDEQFVDFTRLEPSGLFLICGETGSGKTTILDAMCYALYGKSSGGLRGDISVMRCKQAAPGDESFVEFIFENNGERYRFFRSFKPKKKRKPKDEAEADDKKPAAAPEYNITCECQKMEDGEFVPISDAKDKPTFLNSKAAEIIGLTYDQFRQVIILPQGQFEKLLVSNSEEKEKILVTLFHAERWQKLADRMYEQASAESKAADAESELIRSRLAGYECQTPAELNDKTLAAAEALTLMKQELEEAEKIVALLRKQNEAALLDNQSFEQQDRLLAAYRTLEAKSEQFARENDLLAKADKAEQIAPAFAEYNAALTKKKECEAALSKANQMLSEADAAVAKILALQQRHEERRPGYNRGRERAVLLENSRELYLALVEKRTAAESFDKEQRIAEGQAEKIAADYQKAVNAWEQALRAQQEARARQQEAQQRYLEGIGSILAQQLVEDARCPVCGSISHPAPAPMVEGHITDAQLEQLGKAMKSANDQEDAARIRRGEAEKRNTEAQSLLAQKRQQAAVARAEYDQALSRRIEGVEDIRQLEAELAKLLSTIEAYEKEESEMQAHIAAAKGNQQAAQTGVQTAQTALEASAKAAEENRRKWTAARDAADFADDQEYTAACIDANERNERRRSVIQYATDRDNARRAYDEKLKEIEGRERPDLERVKNELKAAETKRDSADRRMVLAVEAHSAMSRDAQELSERSRKNAERHVAADEYMLFAKRLRGDFSISLQRYVLGVMLTSITAAANRLLKTVYGGRYQLFRTNEAAGSSRKRGLELEVYDANNNERRSVTTLSGGEKFLVALSLAIGLSTVVQAQGGGVRLEAMFIDEGFGSLDRGSVADALEVLQGIRRSSGLVGIISHVEQLAETIPAKIQITKKNGGSSCEVIC